MSKNELMGLLEAGDLYGLLLAVGRAWLAKDHPEAEYATLLADLGAGVPPCRAVVLPGPITRSAAPAV